MLEYCEFCELNEDVLRECGFSMQGQGYNRVLSRKSMRLCLPAFGKVLLFRGAGQAPHRRSFHRSQFSIRADLLPNSRRNRLNRNIPNEKRRPQYPAVLVGQLAVSDGYMGQRVGDETLDAIKSWFIEPLNKTGCRYIVVDALNNPKIFDFYQRNGFKFLFSTEEEEWTFLHGRRTAEEQSAMQPMHTRLMYFDLILLRTR